MCANTMLAESEKVTVARLQMNFPENSQEHTQKRGHSDFFGVHEELLAETPWCQQEREWVAIPCVVSNRLSRD